MTMMASRIKFVAAAVIIALATFTVTACSTTNPGQGSATGGVINKSNPDKYPEGGGGSD